MEDILDIPTNEKPETEPPSPKVIEEVKPIPTNEDTGMKRYKCTLTNHTANTKSAIYKYRNYCKKNGTLPEGRGKIVYIGNGPENLPKKDPDITVKLQETAQKDINVEEQETLGNLYTEGEEGQKEAMYSHLKMLEHEAKDHLDGYKVKSTPESSIAVIKEETRFIVSLLQNKGLSKTAYQVMVTLAGFTEQLTQHEQVNPYVDLAGYTGAIEQERTEIEEVLARCIREAPAEFQQMLTPQSHLMIIMTSIAVKVNSHNQEQKRRPSFLGVAEQPSQISQTK